MATDFFQLTLDHFDKLKVDPFSLRKEGGTGFNFPSICCILLPFLFERERVGDRVENYLLSETFVRNGWVMKSPRSVSYSVFPLSAELKNAAMSPPE